MTNFLKKKKKGRQTVDKKLRRKRSHIIESGNILTHSDKPSKIQTTEIFTGSERSFPNLFQLTLKYDNEKKSIVLDPPTSMAELKKYISKQIGKEISTLKLAGVTLRDHHINIIRNHDKLRVS